MRHHLSSSFSSFITKQLWLNSLRCVRWRERVFKLQRVQPPKKEKPETVIINEVISESLPWIINPLSPLQTLDIKDELCYFGHLVPFCPFCHFE